MIEELVWVVDSNLIDFKDKSIINTNEDDLEFLLEECLLRAKFIDRKEAEKSPEYKQIIPYGVIMKDNKILSYQRTKKSGENRLHDNFSIGFGGHINTEDEVVSNDPFDIFVAAFHRELNEELEWGTSDRQYTSKLIGIISDNSNDVGQVHLGVLVLTEPLTSVAAKEDTISNLEWLSLEEIALFKYENWSQQVLKYLKTKLKNKEEVPI